METLGYIIKLQVIISVLYLVFILFVNKKCSPLLQRIFLLMIVPVSILLPFIKLPVAITSDNKFNEYILQLPELIIDGDNSIKANLISIEGLMFAVYLIISFVILSLFLHRIYVFKDLINKSKTISINGQFIKIIDKKVAPSSFLSYIVLGSDFLDKYKDSFYFNHIIDHEAIHCNKRHFLDLIYIFCLQVIFWFNPIVWLIGKSIKEVHEYEVDSTLIRSGIDFKQYAQLLVNVQTGFPIPSLGSHFSYLSIKNRIIMMSRQTKNQNWRILISLPIIVLLVVINSCGDSQKSITIDKLEPTKEISSETKSTADEISIPADTITFAAVDVKPKFEGGDQNTFTKWVFKNIKYPEYASKNGVQGRVVLSFAIDTKGNINDIKLLKGVDKSLDDEAIRVVSMSPRWEPGMQDGKPVNVKFTFPVIFQLR